MENGSVMFLMKRIESPGRQRRVEQRVASKLKKALYQTLSLLPYFVFDLGKNLIRFLEEQA
ncbi:hypothetical protein OH492_27490 [Vibrio chagasii]|nr:hypothetical protein [Vibrio chagasii]